MQRFFALLASLAFPVLLPAQQTWYKILPVSTQNETFSGLSSDGNYYFIHTSRGLTELDRLGSITGNLRSSQTAQFWTSAIKRYTNPGVAPYFLITGRQFGAAAAYPVMEYRPGIGIVNEKMYPDSLANFNGDRPVMLEMPDGALLVAGRQFYRKLRHSPANGFEEEWVRPLNLNVSDALIRQGTAVIAANDGTLVAIEENGDILWTRTFSMAISAIAGGSNGYAICGRQLNGKTAVTGLNNQGEEIWTLETEEAELRAIAGTPDGGYAVTGRSGAGRIVLCRIDNNGTLKWREAYGAGTGMQVLQDTDSGFVVLGRRNNSTSLDLIKTDSLGQTGQPEPVYVQNRQVANQDIRAYLGPVASLFGNGFSLGFSTLPDSATLLSFFAPWLGGYDENSTLHLAADELSGGSRSDYRPGFAQGVHSDFQRTWLVRKPDIKRLRRDFLSDQKLDQPVPYDLLTWPGKGNPHLRQNLDFTLVETDANLFPAPFEDANGDGLYNVYDGDVPLIKGDQMVWWIMTDDTVHANTNGNRLGVDMPVAVYVYDCPGNNAIEKSLFAEYTFINRSANRYREVYSGFFANPNLGCFYDDAFGAMPGDNTFYVYNADETDGPCDFGFDTEIPVQTVTLLNRALTNFMYYNNPSEGNPPAPTHDPDLPFEYYRYLSGHWKDGTPLTKGGSGYYNSGNAVFATHAFPDNPADPQGWSFCTTNQPNFDRRALISHGPFELGAGDTFLVQIVFSLHPDIPHPCPDIDAGVQPRVAQISHWKNSGELDATVDLGQVRFLPPGQTLTLDAGLPGAQAYMWSTGATSPGIQVVQPGNYTVTVTTAAGCEIVENVLVQLGTGVKRPAPEKSWRLLPNPTAGIAAVECSGCSSGEPLRAVLYDLQGVPLVQKTVFGQRLELDLSGRPQGLYWLELWQGNDYLGSRKLIFSGD